MKVSFINNLKARRNRRAVLLLKECSRDAAFNHQLTYLRLVPLGKHFFLYVKFFVLNYNFLIAIVQVYWVLPLERTKKLTKTLMVNGCQNLMLKKEFFVAKDTCFTNEPSLVWNS